jgi:hypothetical protein
MIIAESWVDFRLHGARWIWGKASPIFNREGVLMAPSSPSGT